MDQRLQEASRRHASGEIDSTEMFSIAIRSGMTAEEAVKEFSIDADSLTGTSYCSNNSGGYWWLTDHHWQALAEGGWIVDWAKGGQYAEKDGRYMGALATRAFAPLMTEDQAIESFGALTGEDPYASGCECCGPPHSFY